METQVQLVNRLCPWDRFLSYLWGMETFFFASLSPIVSFVLILPMRNGNCKSRSLRIGLRSIVLILPMRNGNNLLSCIFFWFDFCSYPTYEEWKLLTSFFIFHFSQGVLILPMRNGNNAAKINAGYISADRVLILPMRNGNTQIQSLWANSLQKFLSYLWGMETCNESKILLFHHPFLSYLWGMETKSFFLHFFLLLFVLILPMRNGN